MPHKPFINKKILAHRKVIGEKVRQLRGERRLTLQETSDLCGVSVAHISELERGRISPTVNTMLKVAKGFEKPISFFLPDEYLPTTQITRWDEQKTVALGRATERMLNEGMPEATLTGRHITLGIGGTFEPQADSWGEGMWLVFKGKIELTMNGERYGLKKGDTVHLREATPQQLKNVSRSKAEVMWIRAASPLP